MSECAVYCLRWFGREAEQNVQVLLGEPKEKAGTWLPAFCFLSRGGLEP